MTPLFRLAVTPRVDNNNLDFDSANPTESDISVLFESRSSHETLEHPNKRRRLDPDQDPLIGSASRIPDEDYVQLAKYTFVIAHELRTHCNADATPITVDAEDDGSLTHLRQETGSLRRIDVSIDGAPADLPDAEEKYILIRAKHTPHETVTLACATASFDDVGEHLALLTTLPSQPLYGVRESKRNAAWVQATLDQNQRNNYVLEATICAFINAGEHQSELELLYPRAYCHMLNLYRPVQHREPNSVSRHSVSSSLFYDAVHTPDTNSGPCPATQHPELQAELYPFQKRAVSWMLSRERVRFDKHGTVQPMKNEQTKMPLSYHHYEDCRGNGFHASPLLRKISRNIQDEDYTHQHLRGGILCEEMGLGKTVELVDLMLLHRRKHNVGEIILDEYSGEQVKIAAGNLIICPPAILNQWMSEINSHAPSLKVMFYEGLKSSSEDIDNVLLEQDVVLTTYTTLSSEIHFANKRPDRDLRHKKQYAPRRSPLVKLLWWRVCLDEAQMIESGVSNAATVARRIPRFNAWAITGTPMKKDIKDLLGLLIFLRFEPFCEARVWSNLLHYPEVFSHVFSSIAMRHTKAQLRHELQLPPQKRMVITVPFTAIEEQHYGNLFDQMCADVGLDQIGGPTSGNWDPDAEGVIQKMRTWLTRLRQTCLHPEIGERNRRALGRRQGPLRTVDEVLQVLIDQNETALRNEDRSRIQAIIMQGHIILYTKNVDKKRALEQYLAAFESATASVIECKDELYDETARQKATKTQEMHSDLEKNDDDDEGKDRLGQFRNRLRNALELQHMCAFSVATAYYQVKMQDTNGDENSQEYKDVDQKEADYYEIAKQARQTMLRSISTRAKESIRRLRELTADNLSSIPTISKFESYGGIQSRKIFSAVEDLRDLMNRQADQLQEWRSMLVGLLTRSLLDQDDVELTGEEYEQTLQNQDEQYVYLFVLRATIADRREMITGDVNELVFHETETALKQAIEGEGHSPELSRKCLNTRNSLLPARGTQKPTPRNEQSLRGIISDLRSVIAEISFSGDERNSTRIKAEVGILEEEMANLQRTIESQTKTAASLEKEFDLCRTTMNDRLEFYRQLQAISDTVQPYKEVEDDFLNEAQLELQSKEERLSADKLRALHTKRRFLQHLKEQKTGQEERRPCIICMQPFENGVITVCAHEFCKDCISIWLRQHSKCPICKKVLRRTDYHNITYKPRELKAEEETEPVAHSPESSTGSPSTSSKSSIFSSISEQTLNEINSIEIPFSWGTKIDSIVRHIIFLRTTDPGCKMVVFSQYRDFLSVLGRALRNCHVGHSAMVDKAGIQRFKEDASVECFLLHAKADSSGLNLVNATHVLLCEPLVNTAIELQAIARVHRIGQRQPTTVWMVLVSDTVEEAIYDLSVTRRLEMMGGSVGRLGTVTPSMVESKLDAINSAELQSAPLKSLMDKGHSNGELVAKTDLWSCLFGKPRRRPNPEVDQQIGQEVGRHLRGEAAEERITLTSR